MPRGPCCNGLRSLETAGWFPTAKATNSNHTRLMNRTTASIGRPTAARPPPTTSAGSRATAAPRPLKRSRCEAGWGWRGACAQRARAHRASPHTFTRTNSSDQEHEHHTAQDWPLLRRKGSLLLVFSVHWLLLTAAPTAPLVGTTSGPRRAAARVAKPLGHCPCTRLTGICAQNVGARKALTLFGMRTGDPHTSHLPPCSSCTPAICQATIAPQSRLPSRVSCT